VWKSKKNEKISTKTNGSIDNSKNNNNVDVDDNFDSKLSFLSCLDQPLGLKTSFLHLNLQQVFALIDHDTALKNTLNISNNTNNNNNNNNNVNNLNNATKIVVGATTARTHKTLDENLLQKNNNNNNKKVLMISLSELCLITSMCWQVEFEMLKKNLENNKKTYLRRNAIIGFFL
jgi:hypothetical protein